MAFKKIKKYLDNTHIKTALFVFDEPSGSLDNTYRDLFIQLLLECYRQKPFSSIIITHDYSVISTVEEKYKQLAAGIEYKELASHNGTINLSAFSKDEYLGWINSQTYQKSQTANNEQAIVKIKSGVEIFSKTLSFH